MWVELGNFLLACFRRWKIYQVEIPARFRGERYLFVFFLFLFFFSSSSLLEITVEKYHAIHSKFDQYLWKYFPNLCLFSVIPLSNRINRRVIFRKVRFPREYPFLVLIKDTKRNYDDVGSPFFLFFFLFSTI